MLEILILLYLGICWLVFKKFKLLPFNKVTGIGAAMIGIFGLGFLLLMMSMYQPHSRDLRIVAPGIPIISQVAGRVLEVPVVGNRQLKAGDVLFRIDDVPYKAALGQLSAQLDFANLRLKQSKELVATGAGSVYDVQQYEAEVARLTDAKVKAQYDLDNCVVRAPTDGYVTQVFLRPGMMLVAIPFSQAMTFIPTGEQDRILVASFPQQALNGGIDPKDNVEIAFDGRPGTVFYGEVDEIIPAIMDGVYTPQGSLRGLYHPNPRPGRVLVKLRFKGDLAALNLPIGAAGDAVVYTGNFVLTTPLRMVLLRAMSWEKWLFF